MSHMFIISLRHIHDQFTDRKCQGLSLIGVQRWCGDDWRSGLDVGGESDGVVSDVVSVW